MIGSLFMTDQVCIGTCGIQRRVLGAMTLEALITPVLQASLALLAIPRWRAFTCATQGILRCRPIGCYPGWGEEVVVEDSRVTIGPLPSIWHKMPCRMTNGFIPFGFRVSRHTSVSQEAVRATARAPTVAACSGIIAFQPLVIVVPATGRAVCGGHGQRGQRLPQECHGGGGRGSSPRAGARPGG